MRRARGRVRGDPAHHRGQHGERWRGELIADGEALLWAALGPRPGLRALRATIHAVHADRRRSGVTDWAAILTLYGTLLLLRDDPVIRVNRARANSGLHGDQLQADIKLLLDRTRRCLWGGLVVAERSGVVAERVMVIQVFVAAQKAQHTLRQQLLDGVLDAARVAVVPEAGREPSKHT